MSNRIRSKSADGIPKKLANSHVTEEDFSVPFKKHFGSDAQMKKPDIRGKQKANLPKRFLSCGFYYVKKIVCLHRPRETDQSMSKANEQNEQTAEQKEIVELKKENEDQKKRIEKLEQLASSMASKMDEKMLKLQEESATQLEQLESSMVSKMDEQMEKMRKESASQLEQLQSSIDVKQKQTDMQLDESATKQELTKQMMKQRDEMATQQNQLKSSTACKFQEFQIQINDQRKESATVQNNLKFLNYLTGGQKHLVYFAFSAHDLEKGFSYSSKRFTFGDVHFHFYAQKYENNLVMVMWAEKFSSASFGKGFKVRLLGTNGDFCHTQAEFKINVFINIMPWGSFIGSANGLMDKHGYSVVEVDFTGFNLTGLKGAVFLEDTPNAVLSIGNHTFLVRKELLASGSSFLKELFDGKHGEMEFPDVKEAAFTFFLDAMYGTQDWANYKCYTEVKLKGILQLAERFKAPNVIKRCEQFMKQNFSMEKNLGLALKYNLKDLLDDCVMHYKEEENFNKLISTAEYKFLKNDAKKLFTEMLK